MSECLPMVRHNGISTIWSFLRLITATIVVGCGDSPTGGIPDDQLTARILIPTNDSSFAQGQTILFSGGALAGGRASIGSSLTWTSDVDGPIGTGRQVSWNLLSPAAHTITLTVRDDARETATMSVQIDVAPTPAARVFADRTDEVAGSQVTVLYVLPSDGPDREFDLDQTLSNSVGSFQNWLAGQTGGRELRMDTFASELDIVFVRLGIDDATVKAAGRSGIPALFASSLRAAGFTEADKIYAVYYDGANGTGGCGVAAAPFAIAFLRELSDCETFLFADSPTAAPEFWEIVMLHELMHAQGFVDLNAPNADADGTNHVTESGDLMGIQALTVPIVVFDVGGDDYYGPNIPPGVLDFALSPFLKP